MKDNNIPESNAMKVIRGTGQTTDAPDMSDLEIKKAGKIENYLYHHKWHLGITVGIIIFAVVLIVQAFTSKTPDVYIMYAGPQAMVGKQYEKLESAIIGVMDDYDKNGYCAISFADNTYLNEEQYKARQEMGLNVDRQSNTAAYERFRLEIASGEHMVCMLDPGLYKEVKEMEAFTPLKEICGEIPKGAVDEYGVKLGDTEFYKSNPDISFIPADTVIAVRIKTTLSFKTEEKLNEYVECHRSLFRDIVSFVPEK